MCEAALIYMDKLLDQFPTDESVGHYYWRDAIAPRFVHALLERYRTAVRDRNSEQLRDVVAGLNRIVPLLPPGRTRMLLRLILPLMRSQLSARVLTASMPLARRLYRLAMMRG